MSFGDLYIRNLNEHIEVFKILFSLKENVSNAADIIVETLRKGKKVMFCGNGGSAADSQHLAAEFTGRFVNDRKPLAALALSTDSSALTCISNDYSYADVFSRQIQALGQEGDCLVGISTSGNSKNVIEAVSVANTLGITTIGLLGNDGGVLKDICNSSIIVPCNVTARIQEAHILIGHTLCESAEVGLGLVSNE